MRRSLAALAIVIGILVAWLLLRGDERAPASTHEATVTEPAPTTPTPPARGTHRLAGIVTLEGKPVAGATVRLRNALALAELWVVTGADGRFELAAPRAAFFEVAAEKATLVPASVTIDLRDPRVRADAIELALQPCTAELSGTVRDAVGGPVARARLVLAGVTLAAGGGVEADEQGAYRICVPFGDSVLLVSAAGYAKALETVEAYGRAHRDFALVPEAQLGGRVVRASDRTPVANALVEVRPDPRPFTSMARSMPLHARTDEDGRFEIDGAQPGTYAIFATADGLATARPIYAVAETGIQDTLLVLLGETRTVAGKVTEVDSKAPVPGLTVWLQLAASADQPTPLIAITGADGSYSIEAPPEAYVANVTPRAPIVRMQKVVVTTADVKLDLVVEQAGSIEGRILHEGKPVGDARVRIGGQLERETTSATDGGYRFSDLPVGPYDVYAESERVGAFAQTKRFELLRGEARKGVDVELALASSIAGTVVDQHGVPLAGAAVSFARADDADFGNATTAADGTFQARALAGGGDYRYRVLVHQRSVELPPAVGDTHPTVTVRDANTHITGLRIAVHRELFEIGGRVVDARGKPVAGARLELDPEIAIPPALTDETGAFTLRELPATTFTLTASHAGREAKVSPIEVGRRDVVLAFGAVGALEGTLAGFTDTPDVIASSNGLSYHATVVDHRFSLRDLPVDNYRVSASASGAIDVASVEIVDSVTASLALRARGTGSVAGTVIAVDTRAPLADVDCSALLVERGRMELRTEVTGKTDGRGFYRLDRVPTGSVRVVCRNALGTAQVSEGATAQLNLVAPVEPPLPQALSR